MDVDDLVSEERHDPAGREREGPEVIGGLIGKGRMADGEAEDDPPLDGLEGHVLARDRLSVGRVEELVRVGDQRKHLKFMLDDNFKIFILIL